MTASLQPSSTFAAVPAADHLELARLPESVRTDVRRLLAAMQELDGAGSVSLVAARLAVQFRGVRGFTAASLRRKFYDWKRAGRDWRCLIDRTRAGLAENAALPAEFVAWWQELVMRNQRKCKPAHRALRRVWLDRTDEDGRAVKAIPGYAEWPTAAAGSDLPRGWHYSNLMRHLPTDWELKAVRIGRSASDAERTLVYTTRRDLWCGSHYVFDDMWHDVMVTALDTRTVGRPLEFDCIDLYSACKVGWGMRLRSEDPGTGVNQGLTEEMMRLLVCQVLADHGFNAERGTRLVVERGTATIREDFEGLLHDLSGGRITVARNAIISEPAFAGHHVGRGRGNSRFKAALESLRNLIHNEIACLPGATGKDRDHRPEHLHGLLRANDEVLRVHAALAIEQPDLAERLILPTVEFRTFQRYALQVYKRINERTEHRLEGWDDHHTADERGGLRRLAPMEVWQSGRRGLQRFTPVQQALLMKFDWSEERRVKRQEFQLEDKTLATDALRFDASAFIDGETYRTILSPFQPDRLFVFDGKGGFCGCAPRIVRASQADANELGRAMGRAIRVGNQLSAELVQKGRAMIQERTDTEAHNLAITAEAKRREKAGDRRLERAVQTHGKAAAEAVLDALQTEDGPDNHNDEGMSGGDFLSALHG